jgi:hypothetical protein
LEREDMECYTEPEVEIVETVEERKGEETVFE